MEEESMFREKSKRQAKQQSGGNLKHLNANNNIISSSQEQSIQNSDSESKVKPKGKPKKIVNKQSVGGNQESMNIVEQEEPYKDLANNNDRIRQPERKMRQPIKIDHRSSSNSDDD